MVAPEDRLREAIQEYTREVYEDDSLIVTEYVLATGSASLHSADRENHVGTSGHGAAYATLGLAHMLVRDLEDMEDTDGHA